MILGSTLDMGVGPFLFFHTVNLVVQSLPLEYYTTKINSLPVILEIISLFKEQMVSHKRSTTFSNVENSCGIHACEPSASSTGFRVFYLVCKHLVFVDDDECFGFIKHSYTSSKYGSPSIQRNHSTSYGHLRLKI